MKKQSKLEAKDKNQLLVRLAPEEHERLTELGAEAGFPTANKFVLEAMLRYGDILAEAIIAEDKEAAEVRERSRERLRTKIQSSRR
jgi:hypothetical protein